MLPKKRPAVASRASPPPRLGPQPSQAPAPKRQRVSLACDGCRAAREKCDGRRPQCGPCRSQRRPCSYTPASKKRGVPTGYLRAVELSLAWLLEQLPGSEEALHGLLTGADAAAVVGKGRAAHRLHGRWTESRVHRDIHRALGHAPAPPPDASSASPTGFDSDSSHDSPPFSTPAHPSAPVGLGAGHATAAAGIPRPQRRPSPSSCLPCNWRHLVQVYLAYTHCWLPIVDKDRLMAAAAQYGPGLVPGALARPAAPSPRHAELWAVMAVAAFQTAHSSAASIDPDFPPSAIFSISRDLLPHEDGILDACTVGALLLHALILVGRRSDFAASLLLRKAARLLRRLRAMHRDSHPGLQPVADACVTLDMVTSARLREAPSPPDEWQHPASDPFALPDHTALTDPWSPVYGFGDASLDTHALATPELPPLATLHQLRRFASILAGDAHMLSGDEPSAERLVRSLGLQFSFCNSVIAGESTPMLPSAYLVKMLFLATTMRLVPDSRASLLSSLLEVVEASIARFGACGTPPLAVAVMCLVQDGDGFSLHPPDRSRWDSALSMLSRVWMHDVGGRLDSDVSPTAASHERRQPEPPLGRGSLAHEDPLSSTRIASRAVSFEAQGILPLIGTLPGAPHRALDQLAPNSSALDDSLGSSLQRPLFGVPRQPGGTLSAQINSIDYDAMLEELGTIDFTDSIEMDPQFMLNLGFAPGCDLGDMFPGDFVG